MPCAMSVLEVLCLTTPCDTALSSFQQALRRLGELQVCLMILLYIYQQAAGAYRTLWHDMLDACALWLLQDSHYKGRERDKQVRHPIQNIPKETLSTEDDGTKTT
ncbi:uncharacterized protein B0T23DRAFT_379439 [Neurospora hispaniola]|uniref:Uncharacterized protein n=1 Tax=Neurospora hispaniola TaxID=588809 RepID=A0AAJ0I7D0_9PEZI|nr:hypothetical protein B0T23DRAFT_379439 [Neurospora hispaniola]